MAERAPRVLVVDDDSHVCEMLDRFLSQRGFDVQTAADGEEALRSVPTYHPDVVLLDIRMPKVDGIQALEKNVEGGFDCGVIMISGEADLDVAKNTLTMGAADFIYKPFDLDYLETSLLAKLLAMGRP